jgi:hypothetical protein
MQHRRIIGLDECLNWCDQCVIVDQKSEATPLLRMFTYFSDQLGAAENPMIADKILEILCVFALSDDDKLLKTLVDLSWISLHTIYTHIDVDNIPVLVSCPYAATMSCQRLGRNAYATEHLSISRIVDRIVAKLLQQVNKSIPQFKHLLMGLIRHWGLLTVSDNGLTFLLKHLSSLVLSIKSLLKTLDVSFKNDDDAKKQDVYKKKTPRHDSSIIGLEVASFPEYFDVILFLVVAATGTLTPGQLSNDYHSSPYHFIQECLGLFRKLIEMYQCFILAFPRKSAVTVIYASKEILTISFCQLQRCVDWRNRQPQLSVQERAEGAHDIGSIRYLQQLIDTILSHTTVPILSLCDAWQSSTVGASMKLSRKASLRLTVEKTIQRIKDVSLSHNLSPPLFDVGCREIESDSPTKGFHQRTSSEGLTGLHSLSSPTIAEKRQIYDPLPKSNMFNFEMIQSDSDHDSFGVIGNWGDVRSDVNSDDNSASSLNLDQSSATPLRIVP